MQYLEWSSYTLTWAGMQIGSVFLYDHHLVHFFFLTVACPGMYGSTNSSGFLFFCYMRPRMYRPNLESITFGLVLSIQLSKEPAFMIHLRAFIEIQTLRVVSSTSEQKYFLITFGFIVCKEYFIEKHRIRRWPCVLRWKRPFQYLFDFAGLVVLKA